MDGEYVEKHECRNLMKNETRVEGIYHNKKLSQSKAEQELTYQSLYVNETWNITRKEKQRLATAQRSMLRISLCDHIQSEVI